MTKGIRIKTTGKRTAQAAWHEIGGRRIYFRSRWEYLFALFLQFNLETGLIEQWDYEPKIFVFEEVQRGIRSYKPDFRVLRPLEGTIWYEVKGYMDKDSFVKLKRFRKYFPNERLEVIDGKWFTKNALVLSMIQQMEEKKDEINTISG